MSSGNACCPKCGSAERVIYQGREGGTGTSQDIWRCAGHGEFRTQAR